VSVIPVVSGARAWETTAPRAQMAAPITIDAPIPMVEIPTGRRNVPMAAPIRLNADATPTPLDRTSVGNTSMG
jgi:hypothetical protein